MYQKCKKLDYRQLKAKKKEVSDEISDVFWLTKYSVWFRTFSSHICLIIFSIRKNLCFW